MESRKNGVSKGTEDQRVASQATLDNYHNSGGELNSILYQKARQGGVVTQHGRGTSPLSGRAIAPLDRTDLPRSAPGQSPFRGCVRHAQRQRVIIPVLPLLLVILLSSPDHVHPAYIPHASQTFIGWVLLCWPQLKRALLSLLRLRFLVENYTKPWQ